MKRFSVSVLILKAVAAVFFSFFLCLLFGCASISSEGVNTNSFSKRSIELTDAASILSQMTLEEKVAQLFIVAPEQLVSGEIRGAITKVNSSLSKEAALYPVSGFILFGRNIKNPSQTRALTKKLSGLTPIPAFLAIDEEGGRVSRLSNNDKFNLPKFSSMEAIGKTGNIENARGAGQTIGGYLSSFGFTLDFAPVADVNTNPENIVIGDRAFGENPQLVSDMAGAFLSALHSAGVKGCLKHFPGHGDTEGDTHTDYVAVTKSWDELKTCELIPFVNNFTAADTVMVAHVTCTKIDSDYPASLSKKLIAEKLRGELGYNGIVLSDALNMGAIEKNYGSGEACVLAFEAGNDILLMPKDFFAGYNALLNAVYSGRISEDRLNESVLRVLKLKGY